VTARVSIKLPTDCWRFIEESRSWPTRVPLSPDVQTILARVPAFEIEGAIPEPRVVIEMGRDAAGALQRWLHGLYDSLKHDDQRRLLCLLCISRVAVAIRLSELS
jgi:hypothetical protein